jgi:hypothetical protein
VERGLQPLKVSKPILITLVLAILFAGYTFLFTGKKRSVMSSSPAAKTNGADTQALRPAPAGEVMKLDVGKMNLSWRDDPFFLPRSVTDKRSEKPKTVPKLVAIMESKTGRYAIIGGEIVKKGDMVGDEKVSEISKDKVVLVRNNAKRILSIEDTGQ